MSGEPCLTFQAMTASRTTPTLWVLVIMTGPLRKPESSTQVVPVISPLPLRVNQAAKTASLLAFPRGWMAVTPVGIGPLPISSLPSPEMSVVWPASTPFTSVMALLGPGVPSKGTPISRARVLVWADTIVARATKRVNLVRPTCDGDMRASGKAGSIRHAQERKVAAFGALRAAGRYNRSNVGLFWGERLWIHGRKRWSSVRPARQRFCL